MLMDGVPAAAMARTWPIDAAEAAAVGPDPANSRASGPASTTTAAAPKTEATPMVRRPELTVLRTSSTAPAECWWDSRLNSTVATERTKTECGSMAISWAVFSAYSPGTDAPDPANSARAAVALEAMDP